jgi:hypothetical protein
MTRPSLCLIVAPQDRQVYTVLGLSQHDVRLGPVFLHRKGGLQLGSRLLMAVDQAQTERIIRQAQLDATGQR